MQAFASGTGWGHAFPAAIRRSLHPFGVVVVAFVTQAAIPLSSVTWACNSQYANAATQLVTHVGFFVAADPAGRPRLTMRMTTTQGSTFHVTIANLRPCLWVTPCRRWLLGLSQIRAHIQIKL